MSREYFVNGDYLNVAESERQFFVRGAYVNTAAAGVAAALAGVAAGVVTATGDLATERKLSGTLRDRDSGNVLQVSGWRYAVFSGNPGDVGVTITDRGTNFSTDANGHFEIDIPNSVIAVGQTAFLLAHSSDGTLAQSPVPKQMFAPIVVG